MLRALQGQGLLCPLPPRSPGPNGIVFPIHKSSEKYSLVVNVIPVNRESPQIPESFSLPTVEMLALMAMVAVLGSRFFFSPPRHPRSRVYKDVWDILALPTASRGLGDNGLYMCHIDVSNCFWSLIHPKELCSAFRFLDCEGGGGVLAFRCLLFGSLAQLCVSGCLRHRTRLPMSTIRRPWCSRGA